MKSKAARASLVGVLTAALSISLLPPANAYPNTADAQQGTTASRPRRGKNGAAVRTPDSQDTVSEQQSAAQDLKAAPESRSVNTGSGAGDTAKGSDVEPPSRDFPRSESKPEREAPPFDRPPLRSGSRSGTAQAGGYPGGATPPSRERPVYPDVDNKPQPGSADRFPGRPQTSGSPKDRSQDTSSGTGIDPERSNRSSGGPPVLRRPADSRPRDEDGDVPAAKPPASSDDDVIKLESTLVNMPLLVSDRSGRYVPQLSARDFALYEDGVQQKIASFGSEEVPFHVVLLLDVSPSVQGNEQDIQDAAIAFVRQLRDQDRVMVVSFDRSIHYLSDFTSDRRQLEWAIRKANTGSGTSVYDAVYEVVDRKLRNVEGRKALIIFSDGEDTTSSHFDYDDPIDLVSESDVLVYGLRYPGTGGRRIQVDPWPRSIPRLPLPFPWPWPMPRRRRGPFTLLNANPGSAASAAAQSRSRQRGGDFMADITAAGGGPVYDAERVSDLSRLANRIAEELRHVYVISYYPTNPLSNGGYRSVRVNVPGRSDIAVRHRRGYNARPSGSVKSTT